MAEISDKACEGLRAILEEQCGQTFTVEETKEIGEDLISFFRALKGVEDADNQD